MVPNFNVVILKSVLSKSFYCWDETNSVSFWVFNDFNDSTGHCVVIWKQNGLNSPCFNHGLFNVGEKLSPNAVCSSVICSNSGPSLRASHMPHTVTGLAPVLAIEPGSTTGTAGWKIKRRMLYIWPVPAFPNVNEFTLQHVYLCIEICT